MNDELDDKNMSWSHVIIFSLCQLTLELQP